MSINLKTLIRSVYNEETAIEFLKKFDIIPKEKLCENDHVMKICYHKNSQPRWRCNLSTCGKAVSVRRGTWLENTKLSFENIVLFIYFWSCEMTNMKWCERELNISHSSVVDWNNYLREVCVFRVQQSNLMIGGEGMTVEIEVNLFSQQKKTQERTSQQQWIFGGLCRETKECFAVRVSDRSAETLLPIIIEKIKPGSTIMSDQWQAYNNISSFGFTHQTFDQRSNFVDPTTLVNTQQIKRMWGLLKEDNSKRRGTDKKSIDSYLAEFLWKSKLDGQDAFQAILNDISEFWKAHNTRATENLDTSSSQPDNGDVT